MKLLSLFSLLAFSLLFFGCASKDGSDATATEEGPAAEETSSSMGAKTAYEGSTGSGLLMERYKAGQIEGYRE